MACESRSLLRCGCVVAKACEVLMKGKWSPWRPAKINVGKCPGSSLFSSLLKKIERETWRESGVSLIATVTRLMERLLDYR